jgi:hypothetical protein
LDEVIVTDKSHAKERKENLRTFRNVFLGTTGNANNCEITNENDIRFKFSSYKDTLKAFAMKPILIDNRALGYKLTYYLDKFEYNKQDSSFLFIGNIIFREDSRSIEAKKKYIKRNRENAYFGSRMHFFRSLWFDDLDSVGFKIRNSSYDTLDYKHIVAQYDKHSKYLKYHGSLGISYFNAQQTSLLIFLKDSVLFDPNGYFEPYAISWEGEMAQKRIADQLPYEYSIDE